MKFIVDLWLDGYLTTQETEKACVQFMEDQLDFAGSSVKITKLANDLPAKIVRVLSDWGKGNQPDDPDITWIHQRYGVLKGNLPFEDAAKQAGEEWVKKMLDIH